MEVVRLAPNAADAYQTLGNIFQVKGEPRKALDFFMIAAHLPPKVLTPAYIHADGVASCPEEQNIHALVNTVLVRQSPAVQTGLSIDHGDAGSCSMASAGSDVGRAELSTAGHLLPEPSALQRPQ